MYTQFEKDELAALLYLSSLPDNAIRRISEKFLKELDDDPSLRFVIGYVDTTLLTMETSEPFDPAPWILNRPNAPSAFGATGNAGLAAVISGNQSSSTKAVSNASGAADGGKVYFLCKSPEYKVHNCPLARKSKKGTQGLNFLMVPVGSSVVKDELVSDDNSSNDSDGDADASPVVLADVPSMDVSAINSVDETQSLADWSDNAVWDYLSDDDISFACLSDSTDDDSATASAAISPPVTACHCHYAQRVSTSGGHIFLSQHQSKSLIIDAGCNSHICMNKGHFTKLDSDHSGSISLSMLPNTDLDENS